MNFPRFIVLGIVALLIGCKTAPTSSKSDITVDPDSLQEFCNPSRIPAHTPPPNDSIYTNTAMMQGFGGMDVALLPQIPLIKELLLRRCGWKVESDGLISTLKIDSHYDVHAVRLRKPDSACSGTTLCEPCEAYLKLSLSGKPLCLTCYGCPGPPAKSSKIPLPPQAHPEAENPD